MSDCVNFKNLLHFKLFDEIVRFTDFVAGRDEKSIFRNSLISCVVWWQHNCFPNNGFGFKCDLMNVNQSTSCELEQLWLQVHTHWSQARRANPLTVSTVFWHWLALTYRKRERHLRPSQQLSSRGDLHLHLHYTCCFVSLRQLWL